MSTSRPRKLVFFIDRIEHSSYPVTETGYALVHRAWLRARSTQDEIFVVYPDALPGRSADRLTIPAHRVTSFDLSPYYHYRGQRDAYHAGEDAGSLPCHVESEAEEFALADADAIVWRQESGTPERTRELLLALASIESETTIYQSPRLALDPQFGSKVLPAAVDARFTPRTFYTHTQCSAASSGLGSLRSVRKASPAEKVEAAVAFIARELGDPETALVKPLHANNGVGIAVLGSDPRHPPRDHRRAADDRAMLSSMLATYGDLVVQEYIASIRAPSDLEGPLATVQLDRRDFGEVRFLLIDGKLPRTASGHSCVYARRVPVSDSLVADSGISHPTTLSVREQAFIEEVGQHYLRWGIYFGGGDLIRTPDASRPFVFTDAARSVCGHAVVTGALNGQPYLIIDQILDSLEGRIIARRAPRRPKVSARASAWVRHGRLPLRSTPLASYDSPGRGS